MFTKTSVLRFNLLPAAYADASWYDAEATVPTRLARLCSPEARRPLSQWLLSRYELGDCVELDFSTRDAAVFEKGLCLCAPSLLHRLAVVIGVLRYREQLRRRVGDGALKRLGQELGVVTVRQALALWPAPTFLAPAEQSIDVSATHLTPQLLECGARWWFGWIEPLGRAVVSRVRFKFPRTLAESAPVAMDDAARVAARDYLETFVLRGNALCQ